MATPMGLFQGVDMSSVGVLGSDRLRLVNVRAPVALDHVRRFRACLGNSSASIAVGLARLGVKVSMIGAVSDGALRRFPLQRLVAEKVDVTCAHQQVRGHNVSLSLTEASSPRSFHQFFAAPTPAVGYATPSRGQEEVIRTFRTFVANETSFCANVSHTTTLHALRGGCAVRNCLRSVPSSGRRVCQRNAHARSL